MINEKLLNIVSRVIILSRQHKEFGLDVSKRVQDIAKIVTPLLAVLMNQNLLNITVEEAAELSAMLLVVIQSCDQDPFLNEEVESLIEKLFNS